MLTEKQIAWIRHLAVCDDKKQYLDPGRIGGGGIKAGACIHGRLANLVMHLLVHGEWPAARMLADTTDEYGDIERSPKWRDITVQAVGDFNRGQDGENRIPLASELILVARQAAEGLLVDIRGEPMTNERAEPDARAKQLDRLHRVFDHDRDFLAAHLSPEGMIDTRLHVRADQADALIVGYSIGFADGLKRTGGEGAYLSTVDKKILRKHLGSLLYGPLPTDEEKTSA